MKTKKLVEVALLSALTIILSIIFRQFVSLFDSFSFLLCLPFVYISYKFDLTLSGISLFSTFLLSFFFNGIHISIVVFIKSFTGTVYGYLLKKNYNKIFILFFTFLIVLFSNFITIVLFAEFFGYDISKELELLEMFFNKSYIKIIIPSILILYFSTLSLMEMYLINISSRLLLSRLKILNYKIVPIYFYKANKKITIFMIVLLIISMIFIKLNIFINLFICILVFLVLYFSFFGFTFINLLLKSFISDNFKFMYVFSILLIPILNIFLVFLGIYYLLSNVKYKIIERTLK